MANRRGVTWPTTARAHRGDGGGGGGAILSRYKVPAKIRHLLCVFPCRNRVSPAPSRAECGRAAVGFGGAGGPVKGLLALTGPGVLTMLFPAPRRGLLLLEGVAELLFFAAAAGALVVGIMLLIR